jgi:outer membrane protein assembly factor BamE (lipoprotein component of BamABCDE complex)
MKYFYTLIFIFIINCSGNKVSNYHGSKSLENQFEKLIVNKTNKNDIIKIIGPPSTISEFDKNKWFYIERLKTNQSLIKLGTQKIKKNNVLILELKNNGTLKKC